ncbi:FtsQ-type POTRA domain-containing protein [Rossellomorea vietnamensis]|uniref:Cell division protein DivIB n=1 Tax=Rossellomorea vietnamensis TaxID=218284 RepID=A0A5D4MAE9_9BACI|nr:MULTISPECIES: FtsQ-type POTRA domain-containing protein [Bacillaceae]TYR98468.1 FtsQ-type POTRA domain-containing protein [Rossellomorea vietnamensis]
MDKGKIVSLEERIPKLKQHRKKKANRRLTFLLSLFLLLILAVVYFQSSLSQVNEISVAGNQLVSNEDILKEITIEKGMNVWSVDRSKAEKELEGIAEIAGAEVKLQLPNTVKVNIDEFEKTAYLIDENQFYPILENGEILDSRALESLPTDAPILLGFKEDKILKEMVNELKNLPSEITNSISEIVLAPKKTDQYHVSLYMNDGFEVSASIRTFSEKMVHYPSIVSQLDESSKGVIDLEVGSYFREYEKEGAPETDEDESES